MIKAIFYMKNGMEISQSVTEKEMEENNLSVDDIQKVINAFERCKTDGLHGSLTFYGLMLDVSEVIAIKFSYESEEQSND